MVYYIQSDHPQTYQPQFIILYHFQLNCPHFYHPQLDHLHLNHQLAPELQDEAKCPFCW